MQGIIKVSYIMICHNDINIELTINKLLKNDRMVKAIKNEFATGLCNLVLSAKHNSEINIKTKKDIHTFEMDKKKFGHILALAEEDALKHKRLKKSCARVEIIDIVTLNETSKEPTYRDKRHSVNE